MNLVMMDQVELAVLEKEDHQDHQVTKDQPDPVELVVLEKEDQQDNLDLRELVVQE